MYVLASLYFFGTNKTNWNKAKDFCKANSGHLVIITDELEHLSVKAWLNTGKMPRTI